MKIKELYQRKLGNKSDLYPYKKMSNAVVDSDSFDFHASMPSMISGKTAKRMKMGSMGQNRDALWSPTGPPIPFKPRHRKFMGLSD